jgi:hypothetical protein
MTSSSSSTRDAKVKQAGQQVRTYLASLPPEVRREMKKVREIVRATAPGAVEVFSYGIPGFKLEAAARLVRRVQASHQPLPDDRHDSGGACGGDQGIQNLDGDDSISTRQSAVIGSDQATREGAGRRVAEGTAQCLSRTLAHE